MKEEHPMHIEEIIQKIAPTDKECAQLAQARFDALIKPVGSLAQLEKMTAKYAWANIISTSWNILSVSC